jgi:zinc and cadmium transporter
MNAIGSAAGGLVPLVWARPGEPGAAVHGFAAGTLLGAGLLVLMPGAVPVLGEHVGVSVLAGFLILYLLDRILLGAEFGHGHGHAEAGHAHHMGALATAGFSVHTIADGAALGLTGVEPALGLPVFLGILFHEVPAKFVFARLLVASGARRSWVAAGVAGLAALLIGVAYLTRAIAHRLPQDAVPQGLGASAGMFLFLATSELLPREHEARRGRALATGAFLAGCGVAYLAHWIGE